MAKKQQMSLFDGGDTTWEIKKHSSIVQLSNITTLLERKAMNSLIRIAKDFLKRNSEQRAFECDIGLLKRLSGLNDSDNSDLKEALRNLASTKLEYNIFNKDKEERGIFSFLAEVRIVTEGRGRSTVVSFEFPTTVWNVVRNPNMYVKLDLLIVRGLTSKHSVALYELMKDYQSIGKKRCEIDEFRRLMGIKPGQYSIFTMLKHRVLDVAVNEINEKTDIKVGYTLENVGRKVTALLLNVVPKDEKMVAHNASQSIREKLHEFGVNDKKTEALLKKHDEQYLWANIAIVEEQLKKGKISNTTGYLLKSFESDFRATETEYDQRKKKQKSKREQEDQAKEEREAMDQQLVDSFERRKQEHIKAKISLLSEIEIASLKDEFVQNTMGNEMFKRIYQTKGFDHPVIQIQRNKFLAPILLTIEELDILNFTMEGGAK